MKCRAHLALPVLGTLIFLGACVPESFVTHVDGYLGGQIEFSFYESEDAAARTPQQLVSFEVWELGPPGEAARQVWKVTGSTRLASIVYGTVPEGLKELTPSKPLAQEGKYLAEAHHRSLGSARRSRVAFLFDGGGRLIEAMNSWDFGPLGDPPNNNR